jgi:hypothetical protein
MFDKSSSFKNHKNRKIPCKKTPIDLQYDDPNQKTILTCKQCDKSFSRIDSLKRHHDKCDKVGEMQNQLDFQNEQINLLKKQINGLKSSQTKNIQNNIQNYNNCGNINIVAYGKEDMSYLTDDEYKKIMLGGDKCLLKYIEVKHFNKQKKEHSNIYISNSKLHYLITFDGNDWNLKQADPDVIDMLKTTTNQLIGKYEDLKKKLDKKTKKAFVAFLKRINYEDECHDIDDVEEIDDMSIYIKTLLKDTKLLLYNKRKLSDDNQNEMLENDTT